MRTPLSILQILVYISLLSCNRPLIDANRDNFVKGTINGKTWNPEILPKAFLNPNRVGTIDLCFYNCLEFDFSLYSDALNINGISQESIGDTLELFPLDTAAVPYGYYIITDYDVQIYESWISGIATNWLYIRQVEDGFLTGSFSATLVAQNREQGIPDTLQFEVSEFRVAYPTPE